MLENLSGLYHVIAMTFIQKYDKLDDCSGYIFAFILRAMQNAYELKV